EGLEASWAAHDAEAYGAAFTADATYTTFAGTHYVGRQDIVDSHAALFEDVLEGTRLDSSYLALRFLTHDVAVLTVRGDTYEGDTPGTPTKVQTYTLVRADGDGSWSVAAFQNTQRKALMERVQFLWMPGTVPAAER
ncbi:SgcJ/EcaC family oxidoreductase, partial [Isoptericola halotolerans]